MLGAMVASPQFDANEAKGQRLPVGAPIYRLVVVSPLSATISKRGYWTPGMVKLDPRPSLI
jgi:hypothetical protein